MEGISSVSELVKIKVVGLGGAGCNAITRMVREQIHGVEFIAMNTDAGHLAITEAPTRIELGERVTHGLGAGGDHIVGLKAAEESIEEIKQAILHADMVFITAGMGGGTGTGSAPLVASVAKRSGALTIAIVTRPFEFEGIHRKQLAEEGIRNLIDKVDALIIVSNEHLLERSDRKMGIESAFKVADETLFQSVRAITEMINVPGIINLDFASIRAILKDGGPVWMSTGKGTGVARAVEAAKQALINPLMDISPEGANRVLFNVMGRDLTLSEVKQAAEVIQKAIALEANIIFGIGIDPTIGNDVRLTLVATGFNKNTFSGYDWDKQKFPKGPFNDKEFDIPPLVRKQHVPPGR